MDKEHGQGHANRDKSRGRGTMRVAGRKREGEQRRGRGGSLEHVFGGGRPVSSVSQPASQSASTEYAWMNVCE